MLYGTVDGVRSGDSYGRFAVDYFKSLVKIIAVVRLNIFLRGRRGSSAEEKKWDREMRT